jgi:glycosyltransferase involved in cell wall biosynthesis
VKAALGLAPEEPLLLFFGKAQMLRGIDTLLQAFVRVAELHDRARLLLLLRPDASQGRVARLVAQLPERVRGRVHLCVETKDPRPSLAAADLVVLPFRSALALPAQPLTLLEAMACGKPVVSTEIPPVREVLTPGEGGLLAPPGDAEALAERILWALRNPEEARRLGERARERVLREYSWDEIADRTDRFYRRALEGG